MIKAEFIKSASEPSGYPPPEKPEIAFVGRSNVGKSSMINAILDRKKLVKVGKTPGKTRLLNFFNIDDRMTLVDLPGYGFARVSKTEKEKWGKSIEAYLGQRENLRACVLIMDVRHLPTNDDMNMLSWLEAFQIPVIPVLTKCDKLSGNKLTKQVNAVSKHLMMEKDHIVLFSAMTKKGKDEIWDIINEVICEDGAC